MASELQPLASKPLPEIPVESTSRGQPPEAPPAATAAAAAPGPEPAPPRPRRRRQPRLRAAAPRTSRAGGAVLLAAGAAVVIAVVLVLVLSGGGGKKRASRAAAAGTTSAQSTAASKTTTPQVIAQINLNPPSGGSAKGIAEVLRQQGKTGIAIVAQGLTPNQKKPPNAYAVWLYNSPTDSRILGFVNPGVSSNGRLQTAGGLPTNASHFQKLLVTLETQSKPKSPGTIVLEGALTGV